MFKYASNAVNCIFYMVYRPFNVLFLPLCAAFICIVKECRKQELNILLSGY
ncbi:MAG: hypothetical protein JWO03_3477 [Bacteroidetes bacterium]|nr:hypothetical protein [Bacteroidota bacterium]